MRMIAIFLCTLLSVESALAADGPPAAPHLKPKDAAGPSAWTAGPYAYDGAGNIIAIGGESFVYDKVGRLRSAAVRGPDMSTMQTQTFGYDAYGNLINTSKLGQTVPLPTSTLSNRLDSLSYDASGNVTAAGTIRYTYDAVGMLNTVRVGSSPQPRIIYAYTADDERLFAFDVSTGVTHWTLRGQDNKVLRDFKQQGSTWSVDRDYIYRDGLLLAALESAGAVEHYTLDHLGTPRLITDATGDKIGYHVYWPFGEEWTPSTAQAGAPLKFTGHERDADPSGGTAPLDYMHARYYGAGWGRFLTVDPILGDARQPQSWNRYAYVRNNPINMTDPDGRCEVACIGIMILGGLFLAQDVLNAPSPTDKPIPNAGPASGIAGAMRGAAVVGSGNAITGFITSQLDRQQPGPQQTGPPPQTEPALRPDVKVSGGRSGENVRTATGPPNSIIRGRDGRILQTNDKGQVIADITKDRVKPVMPGRGFGPKRPPTERERGWLERMAQAVRDQAK